jgi:hypothetical protein
MCGTIKPKVQIALRSGAGVIKAFLGWIIGLVID